MPPAKPDKSIPGAPFAAVFAPTRTAEPQYRLPAIARTTITPSFAVWSRFFIIPPELTCRALMSLPSQADTIFADPFRPADLSSIGSKREKSTRAAINPSWRSGRGRSTAYAINSASAPDRFRGLAGLDSRPLPFQDFWFSIISRSRGIQCGRSCAEARNDGALCHPNYQ